MVRICGSAYWGKSFSLGRDFLPGESDLDVALIDQDLFVRSLMEVRQVTRNYTNLTSFRRGAESPNLFRDYAFNKGIIRTDIMPKTELKKHIDHAAASISKIYSDHFAKVSFLIYDCETSFIVKQIEPIKKFRGKAA